MSETESAAPAEPDAVVERRRGLPLIWLIPLIAAAIGAWLAYTTWAAKGPTITIAFDTASGVEPGKTQIKYRDVAVGIVQRVDLTPDLSHVVVTALMQRSAANSVSEGTQFWIESPQLNASGVSGLSTLISGVYIGMLPGAGKPERHFIGLNQSPVLQVDVPGRKFQLHAERLSSVSTGSPVVFRGIQVGEVLGYSLDEGGGGVTLAVFVRSPYADLIRQETHFWNASGIDLSIGAAGLQVRTQSLATILVGGISFDTPVEASAGPPSPEGASFALYDSYESIREAQYTERNPYLLFFKGSVGGLEPGAPVLFRGIKVGTVKNIRLEIDSTTFSFRIPVLIEIEPQRASITGTFQHLPPGERIAHFVNHGLRAQLQSGNLITGALVVALDFFPQEPQAQLGSEDGIPVIPTVPSQVDVLTQKITVFLDKLTSAPLPELVTDLRATVRDVDALLGSKSLRQGVDGLAPLVESLKQTSNAARTTLAQADTTLKSAGDVVAPDSALRYDLIRLIKELTTTARALRALADGIDRNPNSLIFGKPSSGDE